MESKRKTDAETTQASGSYFGGGFFSGNNSQQVDQIKQELEQVNEDLALAQEELIAKI